MMQSDDVGAREAFVRGEAAGDAMSGLGLGALLLRDGQLDAAEQALRRAAGLGSPAAAAMVAVLRGANADESGARAAADQAAALGYQWENSESSRSRRLAAKMLRRAAAELRKAAS